VFGVILLIGFGTYYLFVQKYPTDIKAIYIKDVGENTQEVYARDLIGGKERMLARLDISNRHYYAFRYHGRECDISLAGDQIAYYDAKTRSIYGVNIFTGIKQRLLKLEDNSELISFKLSDDYRKLIYITNYPDAKYPNAPGVDKIWLVDLLANHKIQCDYGRDLLNGLPFQFIGDRYLVIEIDSGTKAPASYCLYDYADQTMLIDRMWEYVVPSADQVIYATYDDKVGFPNEPRMLPPNNSLRSYVMSELRTQTLDFSAGEFRGGSTAEKLLKAIYHDIPFSKYNIAFKEPDNTIGRLNEMLLMPNIYDLWAYPDRSSASLPESIKDLVDITENYRGKGLADLSPKERNNIKLLNRSLLEAIYLQICPKNVELSLINKGHVIDAGYSCDFSRLHLSNDGTKVKYLNTITKNNGKTEEKWCMYMIDRKTTVPYKANMAKYFPAPRFQLRNGRELLSDNYLSRAVNVYDNQTKNEYLLVKDIENGYLLGIIGPDHRVGTMAR